MPRYQLPDGAVIVAADDETLKAEVIKHHKKTGMPVPGRFQDGPGLDSPPAVTLEPPDDQPAPRTKKSRNTKPAPAAVTEADNAVKEIN